ncbi:MAG: hypothetical protein HY823_08795 [Acidobacteria bacterium]|nr:hypothetical protein [Acidobacteriota bacterium]
MRSICKICGQMTNLNRDVCFCCMTGKERKRIGTCNVCGGAVYKRKKNYSNESNICANCDNKKRIQSILEIAWPILEGGGSLKEVGQRLGLSGERIRQIVTLHAPVPGGVRRIRLQNAKNIINNLICSGKTAKEAAAECGLSRNWVSKVLRANPGLAMIEKGNRRDRHGCRFDPIFRIVEREGKSIRAACLDLGIKCRSYIYKIARTHAAQQRFPCLKNVRVCNRTKNAAQNQREFLSAG